MSRNGKGDTPRPVDKKAYDKGWDRVFGINEFGINEEHERIMDALFAEKVGKRKTRKLEVGKRKTRKLEENEE